MAKPFLDRAGNGFHVHFSLLDRDGVNMLAGDEFKAGLLQPQDPTATQVSLALDPRPGMNVLDFCAAPGTKTTHIAELMADKGSITALDVSEDKRLRITENARRMGIGIINVMPSEAAGGLEIGSFDRVLVDVPCSNTGVLARRPEARWRFDLRSLNQVAADQRTLASMAVMFTRPGGRLVYSTCSIEQEENQQNVRWLLQKHRNLELIKDELTLPGGASDATQWHDGGYYAIFALR